VYGAELTQEVLDDYTTAPISEKLRSTLGFLRKLTLQPEAIGPADVHALRAQGVSDAAYLDASYVAYLFNVYVRLADTLGWHVPGAGAFAAGARQLLKRGYR
jgi:alkylhydroperoxidase family enzyme